jgi:hypothetical protein
MKIRTHQNEIFSIEVSPVGELRLKFEEKTSRGLDLFIKEFLS